MLGGAPKPSISPAGSLEATPPNGWMSKPDGQTFAAKNRCWLKGGYNTLKGATAAETTLAMGMVIGLHFQITSNLGFGEV